MNPSDYIASGVLQDYCLGQLTEEEERAVDVMCQASPEVARELQLLRLALENYVGSNNMYHRAELRKTVWEALKNLGKEK
jgi:uncharacterized phage protein gp47/JayE